MTGPRTFIIRGESQKTAAQAVIEMLPVDPTYEVVIREHKRNRSLDANALMWKWLTVLSAHTGHSKDELHQICKLRYLVPILERDDPDFAAMSAKVREAGLMTTVADKLVSTTHLNTKQFTEYMNEIEARAAAIGVVLPHPDDNQ